MSINVTVSGNPVNIKKGKMVTANADCANSEFQKRRRMRLEQVRQQSKHIAENVRNKVRKEKKKQLSDIEEQGACKLKQWQNRKLLELQQQYCDCLKDIGLGHTEAVVEETREDIINAYKDVLREKSEERGYAATKQLQMKEPPKTDSKKATRDLENVRSAMVSKLKKTKTMFKKKKTKKPTTNINITSIVSDSESNLDGDGDLEVDVSSDYKSSGTEDQSESLAETVISKVKSPKRSKATHKKRAASPSRKRRSQSGSPKRDALPSKQQEEWAPLPNRNINFPLDTRISDRIKRRLHIPLHEPISQSYLGQSFPSKGTQVTGTATAHTKTDFRCRPCNEFIEPPKIEVNNSEPCRPEDTSKKLGDDIPQKPKVALRDVPQLSKTNRGDFNKVQYYDHSNRYSKEYLCDSSCVQKIQNDSIQICPSTSSEQEFIDRNYKRDQDALIRGKRAAEKEKVHKDYRELMRQLPALQKQERIASINSNNPVFHMSDERLKSYKLKKQSQMEDAYEKNFPNTPLITIPPKKHHNVLQTEPFQTIDPSSDGPVLNLATWDVDSIDRGGGLVVTKEDGLISLSTGTPCDRTEYLQNLLDKLKTQKEMLMKEVDSLPKNSSLHDVLKELGTEHESKNPSFDTALRKTGGNEECYCPEEGPCHKMNPSTSKDAKKSIKKTSSHQRIKHKILLSSSNSSSSPSPRKKLKHRKYTLVLQNTSTQTTPKSTPPPPILTAPRPNQNELSGTKTSEHLVSSNIKRMPDGDFKDEKPKTKRTAASQTEQKKLPVDSSTPALETKTKRLQTDEKHQRKTRPSNGKRSKSPIKSGSNSYVPENIKPCECIDEVCQILIKIGDDKPKIVIKSPVEATKKLQPKFVTEKSVGIEQKTTRSKSSIKTTSWREHFSKNNNSLGTSTSTSYFSPPDFNKRKQNDDSPPPFDSQIDPRLLVYIKKLLTMSRGSVEDLGVSSVSDVSTPSSTLMNNDKNNPLNQLKNVIKYFNLNPDELAKCLNETSDTTHGPSTSTATTSSFGRHCAKERKENLTHGSGSNLSSSANKSDSSKSQTSVVDARRTTFTEENYPNVLLEYARVAEMCHERISNLSEMIEKVRQEKKEMLSPNVSEDKHENMTSYLNLPSSEGVSARPNSPNVSVSSTSDREQAELNRKLLEIDYSLAEKLQKLTSGQIKEYRDRIFGPQNSSIEDVDADLVNRYRALLDVASEKVEVTEYFEKHSVTELQAPKVVTTEKQTEMDVPYVPLLLDIPRLPKLTLSTSKPNSVDPPPIQETTTTAAVNQREKKPPPSKGLNAAKRFNDNITNVPHELSTIAEVDSQLSTKLRRSTSPKIFENMTPLVVPKNPQDSVWTSEPIKVISDESVPDILTEPIRQKNLKPTDIEKPFEKIDARRKIRARKQLNVYEMSQVIADQSTDTSTDKSELENVEAMLKSMGMGWAVSTIRKTQEALTRASSSSSSLEFNSAKQHPSDKSNSSDVSLRQFLDNKVFGNVSKTATDSTLSPLTRDFHEISAIQGSGVSSETKNQRTSTPLQTTRSSDKSKAGSRKTMESDSSTVVSKSDEMFVTMPGDTDSQQSKSCDL